MNKSQKTLAKGFMPKNLYFLTLVFHKKNLIFKIKKLAKNQRKNSSKWWSLKMLKLHCFALQRDTFRIGEKKS